MSPAICRLIVAPAALLLALLAVPASAATETRPSAYILELPETVTTVLIAETETATLHRYTRSGDKLELSASVYMSVGENGAGKERAWDRRTPLGIYFVNDRLDTTRLHDKYGAMAFPLDYPNAWDKVLERTGDGIWLHGVDPNGGRRPALDTDGCLALPNEDLNALEAHIQLLVTPVIITRKLREVAVDDLQAVRASLMQSLQTWATSYRDGDWQAYLSLYAKEFEFHGLDKERWSAYRVRAAATRPLKDYAIDQVLMLADPEEENLYLSRFRQTLVDERGSIVTTKRLYWRRDDDGLFRIVAEDNG
jgi:murein L,D-transpeptidase YafK